MKIRPLSDRLVVKRINAETKTSGGLYIPETATEKPQQAEVVAVGPGKTLENGNIQKMSVKVGEKILFSKYSGTEVKVNGTEFLVMREDDVMGVVEA